MSGRCESECNELTLKPTYVVVNKLKIGKFINLTILPDELITRPRFPTWTLLNPFKF